MADVVIKVNQQVSATAIAVMDDGTREILVDADVNAKVAFANDPTDTVVKLSPTDTFVVNEIAVGPGTATLTLTATLSDGRVLTVTKTVEVDALAAVITSLDIEFGTPTLQ